MESVIRRRKRLGRRFCLALAILLAAAVLLLGYMNAEADDILVAVASRQMTNHMTTIVNEAVATVTAKPCYADAAFVTLRYGEDGKITSVSTNTAMLNAMRAEITNRVSDALAALAEYPVAVSYENIFNDVFLFHFFPGLKIDITVEPFGSVESEVQSRFTDAGINQTNHVVEMQIKTSVTVLLIEKIERVETTTNVCIAETVIVGDVPSVWLSGK